MDMGQLGGRFSLDIFLILLLKHENALFKKLNVLNVQVAGFWLFSEYPKGPHPTPQWEDTLREHAPQQILHPESEYFGRASSAGDDGMVGSSGAEGRMERGLLTQVRIQVGPWAGSSLSEP